MVVQYNLQFFGGRGSVSSSGKEKLKVIDISNRSSGKTDKWDYRGEKEYIDKLEQKINNVKSYNSIHALHSALKSREKYINAELERIRTGIETLGDENALLTQRRRIRQLYKVLERKHG